MSGKAECEVVSGGVCCMDKSAAIPGVALSRDEESYGPSGNAPALRSLLREAI